MKFQHKNQESFLDFFALNGKDCFLDDAHLGIVNGHLTTNVTFRDVFSFHGLYAPPYASSNFMVDVRLFGERVPTDTYKWYPFETRREGYLHGIKVSTSLVLVEGWRELDGY